MRNTQAPGGRRASSVLIEKKKKNRNTRRFRAGKDVKNADTGGGKGGRYPIVRNAERTTRSSLRRASAPQKKKKDHLKSALPLAKKKRRKVPLRV